MRVFCWLGFHDWPKSTEMPIVPDHEAMVIRCNRCLQSRVVYGWLRQVFEIVESK